MSDAEYQALQESLEWVASFVRNLPNLDAFVERAERALAVGVYVDPSLHLRANAKLRLVVKIARGLREVQKVVDEAVAAGIVKSEKERA